MTSQSLAEDQAATANSFKPSSDLWDVTLDRAQQNESHRKEDIKEMRCAAVKSLFSDPASKSDCLARAQVGGETKWP